MTTTVTGDGPASRVETTVRVMPRRRRTAVRGAWMLDTTSTSLRADPLVLVEDGRIVAVGHHVDPPDDAEVVDLPGATLLPGLIDTHLHLAFDASADPVSGLAARDDDEALAAMRRAAETAMLGGVTTIRDLGDRDYLSLRLHDQPGLPTIVCAGPPITAPGGHCHFLGGVAPPGADGLRAAVREHAERGVQVIKLIASGGLLTPSTRQEQAQFSPDELRAAVDEAHRLGLPVTAHAHATAAIVNGLTAGIDGLEHVTFWTSDGVDQVSEKIIEKIVVSRVVLGVAGGFAPAAGAALDPATTGRIMAIIANLRRLSEAGAVIVAGTDAGVHPTKPHDVVRYAVAELVALLGMSPLSALRTATSVGAEVCGLADSKGRLAPGYDADILAIDGDPLSDLAAIHRIRAVYARGVRVR